MKLKKRLTTFVSNWLGVILAAIIVLVSAIFGGMYLNARTKLDTAISFATQDITYYGLTYHGATENPPGYLYHLTLQDYNPSVATIQVSISDITITLDTYTFPVTQDSSWEQSVPTGVTYFEGNLTIDKATFIALTTKKSVDVVITGKISGSGKYQFVSRHSERNINIRIIVVFQLVTPSESGTAS